MNSQQISCSFNEICEYWQKIEDTTKRLEKLEYLSKLMIRMNVEFPEDIEPLLLLISNQIREPWLGQSVMNIGEQQVKKAIQNNFQVEPSRMKQDLQTTGDIGQLAQNYKSKQPKMFVQTKQLTVQYILQQFQAIADTQGQNSTQDKIDIMRRLMQDGSDLECRYLTRLLLGKNRLGFQRKTILFALSEYVCFLKMVASGKIEAFKSGDKIVDYVNAAWALISSQQVSNRIMYIWSADEDEEDEEDLMEDTQIQLQDTSSIKLILDQLNSIQQQKAINERIQSYHEVFSAYSRVPSFTLLANHAQQLTTLSQVPLIPISSMLASAVSSYPELRARLPSQFACEFKYDGFRVQIHHSKSKLQVFSRNNENFTNKFQGLVNEAHMGSVNEVDYVIDCELVPIGVNGLEKFRDICSHHEFVLFAFDILNLGGVNLMELDFQTRRSILRKQFIENDKFKFTTSIDVKMKDKNEAETRLKEILNEAVEKHTEGLVIKDLKQKYLPNKRRWLKLKNDYLNGVGDSLDLIIAAKSQDGYLLCSRTPSSYQTVCTIGLDAIDDRIFSTETPQFKHIPKNIQISPQLIENYTPEFWFNPDTALVIEVQANQLIQNTLHTCSQKNGVGIQAVEPILIKIRPDKGVENCSTSSFILNRYNATQLALNEE
ncbi:DNA_ligase [Hexamita inflata]|uniref:DNA ligase n=1 Tax=Hexamita inflata TaxID=28002 RepID=A0AA86NER3_9EUKA|nr:DNA ligase [Hexamita inflata]